MPCSACNSHIYSARWMIELLFRELRSSDELESIPSRKRHVVEAFLYTSLLTLLASRALLLAVRRWGVLGERRTPLERWARIFVSATPELLALVLDPRLHGSHSTEAFLLTKSTSHSWEREWRLVNYNIASDSSSDRARESDRSDGETVNDRQ